MYFSPALERCMTCHAIYWQKARTKSKDIDSSDRLTVVCVFQRVKGVPLHPPIQYPRFTAARKKIEN
jgi:hypothetical protein